MKPDTILCDLCHQPVNLALPEEDLIGCRSCGRGFCIRCGDPGMGICETCAVERYADNYSRDQG